MGYSFFSIFVLWCVHFNALDLEFPFGDRVNDLLMHDMQQDWNNSICALLDKRASQPPKFNYDPTVHNDIKIAMSDASDLYVPAKNIVNKGNAVIKLTSRKRPESTEDLDSLVATGGTAVLANVAKIPGGSADTAKPTNNTSGEHGSKQIDASPKVATTNNDKSKGAQTTSSGAASKTARNSTDVQSPSKMAQNSIDSNTSKTTLRVSEANKPQSTIPTE